MRCVLSEETPSDLDLACALSPAETMALLEQAEIKVVATALKHGTLTAVFDRHNIEITSFRTPGGPSPRAASAPSIQDDLAGRDFTINAVAYSLNQNILIDPFGGVNDLSQRLLRAVGDAETRFLEDPLRIMRLIRFGPAQNFAVDQAVLNSAEKLAPSLESVSAERIRDELEKILVSRCPAQALRLMVDLGIMAVVLPEALPAVGFEQNKFHSQDVFEHSLSVIEKCPAVAALRLAALFHDLGKPASLSIEPSGERHFYEHEVVSSKICSAVMARLRFSGEMRDKVCSIVKLHMRPLECGAPGVRRLMRDLGPWFDDWRAFKIADAPPVMNEKDFGGRLARFDGLAALEKERLSKQSGRLAVNGHDLIALGMRPGIELGRTLKALEELVLEDPSLNTREILLTQAKQIGKCQSSSG